MNKILTPPPQIDLGSSAAVVGNSGQLLDSGYGENIDGADTVIRFNAAPVAGFEEDVGSRTTFRALNAITQKGSTCNGTEQVGLGRLQELVAGDHLVCKRSSQAVFEKAKENYGDYAASIHRLNRRAYYLSKRSLQQTGVQSQRLSLGVLIATAISDLFDSVQLYGFGFHEEGLDRIHYWEDVTKDITAHHDYDAEKQAIHELEQKGVLTRAS
jgi:hypothetical protein